MEQTLESVLEDPATSDSQPSKPRLLLLSRSAGRPSDTGDSQVPTVGRLDSFENYDNLSSQLNPDSVGSLQTVQVTLPKTTQGLGLQIIESTLSTLKVAAIDAGGVADCDGQLRVNDLLIRINGMFVAGWNPKEVVDFLQSLPLGSNVTIQVKRGPSTDQKSHKDNPVLLPGATNSRQRSRKFKLGVSKGEVGFGFILGESKAGPIVNQIVDHSRCARLQVGDIILKVNGEKVKKYSHSDLVNTLKGCPTGSETVFYVHRQLEGELTSSSLRDDMQLVSFDVKLTKHISGFGFEINKVSKVVSQIEKGGAADLDGRLTISDEITHINTHSIINVSHPQVTSMIREAAAQGEMLLGVQRLIPKGPRDVVINKPKSQSSFGFVLQSRTSLPGCKICRLVTDSPAEKCSQLYINDQVLAINGQDVSSLEHKGIISLVKSSGLKICLTVQYPVDKLFAEHKSVAEQKQKHTKAAENSQTVPVSKTEKSPDLIREIHHIELQRCEGTFGFSIRGGKDFKAPLCVLKIVEKGAAEIDGRLRGGDELLEINGKSTKKMIHDTAVSLIRKGGDQVKLVIRREIRPDKNLDSMQLCNEAMKAGFVTVRITDVLLFGMAGAGKTSTKHLIFGLPPPKKRVSTPVAESAERVLIRKVRDISGIKAQVTVEGNWRPVTVEDLKQLVVDIIQYYRHNASNFPEIPEELAKKLKQLPHSEALEHHQLQEENIDSASECKDKCSDVLEKIAIASPENFLKADVKTDTFLKYVSSIITEIQSMVAMEQNCIKEVFGSNWIYFIDSGGQPHFHNLLPLFVQGISVAIYVLRLSDKLDEYPLIEYFKDGRPIGEPFRSHLTTEGNFKFLIQSVQSRNEDCRLVCIGTHLDKISECSETEEDKNTQLLKILPESICEKCHFDDVRRERLIVPINSLVLGPDRSKMAERIRKVIAKCPYREIKVPVWWYNFEIIIEKICNEENCSVMSLDQCRTVAQKLNFHEDALIEALKFFHKHHIFHFYPDILPNVVFCDTQVLLDKITELIEHAAYLRDGTATVPGMGTKLQFRDRGIITLKLLAEFEKHYVDGLFGPPELVKIFKSLLIATSFDASSDKAELFMPSLLGVSPAIEITSLIRRLMLNKSIPLIIQFRNGWPRCGVFCCLQVYLIKECGWSLGKISNKNKPRQNIAKMYLPNNPGLVTLIDSLTYIEVHVESTTSNSKIRDNILSGIESACKALHYDNEEPELAFPCPHSSSKGVLDCRSDVSQITEVSTADHSQDSVQPSRHPATVLANSGWMRCTQCEDRCYKLHSKHKVWLAGLEERSAAVSFEETEVDYSLEDLSKAYTIMVKCSVSLIGAMSKDPRSLAAALFSCGLISQTTLEKTLELQTETKHEKGSRLYNVVLSVIQAFPGRFLDLVHVLRLKKTLYVDILAELDKMFVVDTNL